MPAGGQPVLGDDLKIVWERVHREIHMGTA